MTSTYTANQGVEKPATGDQSGTWGGTVNTNMDIIDRAISGVGALTLTGSTTTLTTTDGTLTDGMYRVLVLGDGGDLGSDNTITLSPNDQDKTYLVYNNLSADRSAIFSQGTGANATVQNGETAWIYADGGGSGAIVRSAMSSVKIVDQDGDTQIQVEEGGDDDDTIRFDLAGAEDFTMSANSLNVLTGSVIALPDATVGAPALTNTGDLNSGIYFPAADTVGVTAGGTERWRFGSNELAGENLIINGDLLVVQRGVSFTGVDPADGDYSLDRWFTIAGYGTPADRYTISQVATSAGALLAGFAKCIRAETTTAETSPHANRYSAPISQRVELQTALQLGYGAAGAKSVTVSFWARSSQTGAHGIALVMNNGSATNPQSYSVSSADTWEYFSGITFSGNTSAAISTGYGLQLMFLTQLGTTADSGSQDTWGNYPGYTSVADIAGATSRYLEITGVQLTVGASGTDFKFEDYSTTLAKCLRYYERITGDVGSQIVGVGVCRSTTNCSQIPFNFTEKRAIPTISINSTSAYDIISSSAGGVATTNLTAQQISTRSTALAATVASGLTDGRPGALDMDSAEFIEISAEL